MITGVNHVTANINYNINATKNVSTEESRESLSEKMAEAANNNNAGNPSSGSVGTIIDKLV